MRMGLIPQKLLASGWPLMMRIFFKGALWLDGMIDVVVKLTP